MRQTRVFSGGPSSALAARRFALSLMDGLSEELRDGVEVMVSELATNAQLHAATDFEVAVERSDEDGRIRVAVSDKGAGEPTLLRPEPTDLHGRGLQIVMMLSDAWGTDWAPDHQGKTVWFELQVPPAQAPPERAEQFAAAPKRPGGGGKSSSGAGGRRSDRRSDRRGDRGGVHLVGLAA